MNRNGLFLRVFVSTLLGLQFVAFYAHASREDLKKFASELQGTVSFQNNAKGNLTAQDGTKFGYNVRFLAKGGFGDVFRISFTEQTAGKKKDEISLVVKVIREKSEDPSDRDVALESAGVQKAIRNLSTFQKNEHFVQYFGTISDKEGRIGILVEGAGGDLKDIYIKRKETPVPLGSLFKQIAQGVGYMHGLGYGHFDLKPANMLLGNDGLVKIIDTDDAENASLPEKTPPISISSLGYTAPEIYNQGFSKFLVKQKVDWRASDIHALGMTFLSLLKRQDPIYLISEVVPSLKKAYTNFTAKKISADAYTEEAIAAIADGKIPDAFAKSTLNDGSEIFKLILKMLNPNPLVGNRPDINEVIKELNRIYPGP